MTSHLTQQPIQDKNGKVTRRWVRPDSTTPVSPALMKAIPLSQPSFDMDAFLQEVASITKSTNTPPNVFLLSDEALRSMSAMLPKIKEEMFNRAAFTAWIRYIVGDASDEVIAVSRHERLDEGFPLQFTLYAVRGLPYYAGRELNDDQVRALFEVTYSIIREVQARHLTSLSEAIDMISYGLDKYWISDDKLVDIIIDNTDEVEHIVDIIETRNTVDADLIGSIINSGVPRGVSEGIL